MHIGPYLAVALTLAGTPSFACLGPMFEDHHFPSCTIPLPASGERIVVLSDGGFQGLGPAYLSSVHVGHPEQQTNYRSILVAPNDAKNFLILDAGAQTVWNFAGDLDSISRVIVLGAGSVGPDGAGVIGIPAEKIFFTKPDLSYLDTLLMTTCTRATQACVASQWVYDLQTDQDNFHPPSEQPWLYPAEILPGIPPETAYFKVLKGRFDVQQLVDPATVVSLRPAQSYERATGIPGLRELVAEGALIPADDPSATAQIAAYAEAFSARYRSRFDPDFLFTPQIDYIVTRAVKLPGDLPPTRFLLSEGVPPPDLNGNRTYYVCYHVEEEASQPVTGRQWDSPLCRQDLHAGDQEEGHMLRALASFDQLPRGTNCQNVNLPVGTEVILVALSEGEKHRYRGDPMRQIDIKVQHDGPVALYLSIEGGPTRWNVTGGQVVQVFTHWGEAEMEQVLVDGELIKPMRLRSEVEGCPMFTPLFPNRLGPQIAELDEIFQLLTGQQIDRIVNQRIPGMKGETAPPSILVGP